MKEGRAPVDLPRLAFGVEPSRRTFRLRLARYRYAAGVLDRHLGARAGRVLDAGCGKGRLGLYLGALGPRHPCARLVGLDLSEERLELARERGYSLLLRSDLTRRWPFASGHFEAVVCEQVLEHFDDPTVDHLLSEAARVLRPGGIALIGTPVFPRPVLWLEPLWRRLNPLVRRLRGDSPPQHLQHFALPRLLGLLSRHGLEPQRVRGFRIFTLPGNALEDHRWYFQAQGFVASLAPCIAVEVNVVARRAGRPGAT